MDRVSINVRKEDVFKSRQKREPIKREEAKAALRTICSTSMLLNVYESSLETLLSHSHEVQGIEKEMATTICQTVKNLNDQVHSMKDALQNFVTCRPETHETQQGFVREQMKSFSRYMDSFDYDNLSSSIQYLGEEFNSKPISIEQLQNSPHGCECTAANVVPKALTLIKQLLSTYENSSL